ncbi:hypothetical protein Nepgr_031455 [Nepenthes gracilis]|uniref:Uncharacterized protein n=1 Tax=Nepenthes gracilis TaxID=150966 RepID=A0AAD3TIX0_NEPGR|nr:hypothetical protein Nepgr_031455 [Nepenthes gracilis]
MDTRFWDGIRLCRRIVSLAAPHVPAGVLHPGNAGVGEASHLKTFPEEAGPVACFLLCFHLLDHASRLSIRLFGAVLVKALYRRLLAWCSSFVRGCHHSSHVWGARSGKADVVAKPLEPQRGLAQRSGRGNRTPGSRTRSRTITGGVSLLLKAL